MPEGLPIHQFMERARDPNSLEASVLRQATERAQDEAQSHLRKMLHQMIELVPGQMFRDIALFHEKFGLEQTSDPNHGLPEELLKFRLGFLLEELREYARAVGFDISWGSEQGFFFKPLGALDPVESMEEAFDGLLDLAYVTLGTAYMHRFPWNDGWSRVQEANMSKVRAESADDSRSTRKNKFDVVKPIGWKKPTLKDLL
jgi:predicted HAD superfamily Cof-like phosphohydrolase